MANINRDDLLRRKLRKGGNPEESDFLLSKLHREHGGENLIYALVYNGYATENQARRYVTANDLQ